MTRAWHLPRDHTENYLPGIDISLGDLLRLEGEQHKQRIPRYVHAPMDGGAHSKHKGRGMDYAESRIYHAGDEIRHIDWRVSARSGKLHTKIFHVERERPVLLLLDQSLSMFFSSRQALKSVIAARLAARALWRHLHAGDRVGLIRLDDQKVTVKRPSSHRADAMALLNQMVHGHQQQIERIRQQQHKNDAQMLHQAWHECRQLVTPGSVVYAFCNLMSLSAAMTPLLAHIARHCDLHVYALFDPLEMRLPEHGRYAVTDLTQTIELDTSIKSVRAQYQQQFEQHRDDWRVIAQQYRFQFFPIATSDGISLGLEDRDHH
jgi:uncharacterized protein (DUF58 family)